MRELLEKCEKDAETKRRVEKLFRLFGIELGKNQTANHAALLWMNNLYAVKKHKIKDVYKAYDENIGALYKYNRIKDTAQEILGRIAEIKRTTNRKIAEEYGTPE